MLIEIVGSMNSSLYLEDLDFGEAQKTCTKPVTLNKAIWLDFIIQDGMLSRGSKLYILKSSMRENLIKGKHNGALNTFRSR